MQDEIISIHHASMNILRQTGIRIKHPGILEMIKEKGVSVAGDIAYFSEDQLIHWVKKAPGDFMIYARNQAHNMKIGVGHTEFAAGYGCPSVINAEGRKRTAVFQDYCRFLKLVQQSEQFKINGGLLVQPADLAPETSLPLMIYAAILSSDKCLMGIPGREEEVEKIMALLAVLFGGPEQLREKPRILTLINTTSPLQIDDIALETMLVCGKYKQPLIISPGPMAGATGPITLAGNLALGNAEALAAIAIYQMIQAGAPVIYGLQATTMDMRSGGVSIGSPGCAKQMVYAARLAKFYGLPCRCGGTNTDAKFPSAQSGYEGMMAMLTACLEKPDFILHSTGILDGYGAMSFEQFIIDLEIIEMIKYFLPEIEISEQSLAVDLIRATGPGGEFLTARHTLENCRSVPWQPKISLRGTLPSGSNPQDIYAHRISWRLSEMTAAYRQPLLADEIKEKLRGCLFDYGVDKDDLQLFEQTVNS